MGKIFHKIKELTTIYFFMIMIIAIVYGCTTDMKYLRKKKLKREIKICKIIMYGYLILGTFLFIITKFIL
ncbi:hypothetical protein SAMN02745883_01244 [Caminicella sporogenes DSM 14501]|uniref:Uncharacterized protein n=1 Tax=Caminicella sporogenes DSM 14501 TaxID=1121266 RepID=A0A1M6PNN9_9FIRM|nr:CLC_0170 family protein [Caminicella sporogenes]RKD22035.1 hypothetical protein BET04_07235 [Caminicella sporogenes]WIF96004.1 hypothetical protein QNI18_05395 [Caminicella sporogenes]SHK09549.1 hypothetical protein SAMN02745883_01244 [Caminicella sporogenes DSM 14501]